MLYFIPLWYYALSGFVNFLTAAIIAIIVFLANKQSKTNQIFSAFSFAVAYWSLLYFIWLITKDKDWAEFYLRSCMMGVLFMPSLFIHFVVLFLKTKINKRFISINYLLSVLFTFTVYTPLYARDIGRHLVFPYWLRPGPSFHIALLHFGAIVLYSFYLMWKSSKKEQGLYRNQILYVFIGTAIGYVSGITNFFCWYRIDNIPPFLNIFVSVYVVMVAIAILRYHLMDINVALTRAGIFAIVYALVLGIPFWVGFRYGLWQYSTWIMLFLATLGPFIYTSLRRQAESRLLAEDLKKYDTLKKFARTMGLVRDLDKLVRLIVYRLVKTLKVSYGAIYLFDEEEKAYTLKSSRIFQGPKPLASTNSIPEDNDFVRFLQDWHKDLLYEDVQRLLREEKPNNRNSAAEEDNRLDLTKVTSQMQELNACLVIPHFLERELIGFLVLGSKLSGRPYSEADIEVLTTLSRSASLAIMNAVFMIELKKTEGELAETHRVAQLGYLASSTGHQISNVLNNIAAIASGLSDSDPILNSLKATPQALSLFEKHIQDIFTNVEDGGMIIRELRDYAQVESDKKFTPVSLKEVLDKTLKVLYIQANKFQTVDISINIAEDVPPVLGSFVQLQNVFVNMLNNAYDAILEKRYHLKQQLRQADYKGRIEINITRVKGNIHIHIIDDGKGIPPDVLKRLFTPLYTTKASSDKRKEQKTTGGTGIGLYTILVIVKNHGGAIKVERTENLKGSDFLIQLPIPKESDIPKGAGL